MNPKKKTSSKEGDMNVLFMYQPIKNKQKQGYFFFIALKNVKNLAVFLLTCIPKKKNYLKR